MAHRDMSEMTRISYLRSEIVVSDTIYEAATALLAGFIAGQQLNDDNQDALMEKSVNLALELAVKTDKIMDLSGKASI